MQVDEAVSHLHCGLGSVADCIAVSPSKFRHMITFLLFQSFGRHEWPALLSFQSYLLGIKSIHK